MPFYMLYCVPVSPESLGPLSLEAAGVKSSVFGLIGCPLEYVCHIHLTLTLSQILIVVTLQGCRLCLPFLPVTETC